MKKNNPGVHAEPVGCYKLKMKDLKAQLESAMEAEEMIEDLYQNNYLPYNETESVRGSILIRIRELKQEILKRKKDK